MIPLKSICLLPILGMLFLPACQYKTELKAEKDDQIKKREEASAYNIQLGMGYLKQGDSPRAKRKFLTALQEAPNSPDVNGAIAYYFEKTGDMNEAKKYYRKAMSLAPTSGSQLNNYGTFLCRTGQYAQSEVYFLKAVKDENYVNTAGAYENAGLCAAAIPDYPKAESYFLKALEQDSRRRQSLYELASIEIKQNQGEKALTHLQNHQDLVFGDQMLLALAIETAHKAGKADLEAMYRVRIASLKDLTGNTGEKNEHNSNNG